MYICYKVGIFFLLASAYFVWWLCFVCLGFFKKAPAKGKALLISSKRGHVFGHFSRVFGVPSLVMQGKRNFPIIFKDYLSPLASYLHSCFTNLHSKNYKKRRSTFIILKNKRRKLIISWRKCKRKRRLKVKSDETWKRKIVFSKILPSWYGIRWVLGVIVMSSLYKATRNYYVLGKLE